MKITPTTMVNMALTAVLLSCVLFIGLTGSVGVYDPYADYDSDGDIDIFDVVPMADAYGTEGDPSRNITIINLPLDEYGNLRTSQVETDIMLLVYNDTLSLPSSQNQIYLTTINVTGWKNLMISAKAAGAFQTNSNLKIWAFNNALGIRTILYSFSLFTGVETTRPDWACMHLTTTIVTNLKNLA